MFRSNPLLGLLLALALGGCEPPDDPEDTTDEVRGERLVLGWIAGVPREGAPEIEAARRLADKLSAELEIVEGPAHELIGELEASRIHLMAGALPKTSPMSKLYGMSRPVGNMPYRGDITGRVTAVRLGENGFLMRLNAAIEEQP